MRGALAACAAVIVLAAAGSALAQAPPTQAPSPKIGTGAFKVQPRFPATSTPTNGAVLSDCLYSKKLKRLVCSGEPEFGAVVIEAGNGCGGSSACGKNDLPAPPTVDDKAPIRDQAAQVRVRER